MPTPQAVDAPAPGADPARKATGDGAALRILVADDFRDSAESLAMLLRLSGHEVHVAYDGEGAVEAAEKHRPDVVLLDLRMPGVDGFEACRRIRRQPWGEKMLLVAQTGLNQEEDQRRAREAGFDGHLIKPVDHNALTQLLTRLSSRG